MIHVVEGKRNRTVNSVPTPHAASITMSLQPPRGASIHAAWREVRPRLLSLRYLQSARENKKVRFLLGKFSVVKTGAEKAAAEASDAGRVPAGAVQPPSVPPPRQVKKEKKIITLLRYNTSRK